MAGAIPAILGSVLRAARCSAARVEGRRIKDQTVKDPRFKGRRFKGRRFKEPKSKDAGEEMRAQKAPRKNKRNLSSMNSEKLQITTPTDREIAMTRVFNAPRRLVFDALTKPELVKRWLLGPPGWSMPVCEIDLRVGGKYRYVWQHDRDGTKMGMGGVYREIKAPERIVNTEKFDEAWYPGIAVGHLVLVEQGGTTTRTHTQRRESRAARDAVIKSNMESGVAASFDRLAELLAEPVHQ